LAISSRDAKEVSRHVIVLPEKSASPRGATCYYRPRCKCYGGQHFPSRGALYTSPDVPTSTHTGANPSTAMVRKLRDGNGRVLPIVLPFVYTKGQVTGTVSAP
jgi:hypothetical protein